MGSADQAMRIWMNPDRMASLSITSSDIANAVNQQNALFGAGQIGQRPAAGRVDLTFPVVTQSPFTDPRQYEQIILRASQDGSAIVRVGDVARAELGLKPIQRRHQARTIRRRPSSPSTSRPARTA